MTTAPSSRPGSLGTLADLGPFFALDVHDGGEPAAPWRPIAELLADPAPRVDAVRAYLAAGVGRSPQDVERRVAASVMHLGLVARLVSPCIGLAARDGVLLPARVGDLRWIPSLGGALRLSLASDVLTRKRSVDLAGWADGLVGDLLSPLVDAADGSSSVVWGNTASAVNGAVLAASAVSPELAPRLRTVADSLLRALPVTAVHTGRVGSSDFRRRSCCLIYRVGGTERPRAVCGDCVLTP